MKVSKGKLEVLLNCYQMSWNTYFNDFDPRHDDRDAYLLKITNDNKEIFVVYTQSIYDSIDSYFRNDIPTVDITLSNGAVLTIPSSARDYFYRELDTYKDALSYVLNTENIVCDIL